MSSKKYQETYKHMSEEQKDAMYKLWQGCVNHDGHSWNTFTEIEDTVAELLKKQIPQPMTLKKSTEKNIIACPDCGVNLAIAYYNEEGKVSGFQCMDDVPPIAKYCRFCGKKFPKDWSDEE